MDADPLTGKTILLVNTGSQKKKFILKRLKKLGLTIVALNKEKNWAQPYVDHWVLTDNSNHSKAVDDLELFLNDNPNLKINGVLTFWEDDVLLTSKIVDKFKFIGIHHRVAKNARNKFLFREFCVKNNILAPKYFIIKNLNDLDYVKNNFSFPVVMKPVYGSSSAFVIKIDEPSELSEMFNYIKSNISTNVESALADGLDIFVEEFIDGDEVDVDILLQNGKIKFYSIADNFNKNKGIFFVDSGQCIPSKLPVNNQQELVEVAEEVLEKLGIQNGCVHFEAKYTNKGVYPIELNLRMGGDYVYSYVKAAWGVDLIEYAVKIAIGEHIKIKKTLNPKKYIIGWDLHSEVSGILVQLDVDEKIKDDKNVEDFYLAKKIGDPILVPPEGYEYLGWITVSGDNSLDAEDNLKTVLKQIHYEVVKFDPTSSVGKTLRKNSFSMAAINKNLIKRAAKIETIRELSLSDRRTLHIGIAGNSYNGDQVIAGNKIFNNAGSNIEKVLRERGYRVSYFDFNNLNKAFNDLQKSNIDLVFNVCDSINNATFFDPQAAAILDILQIPYTGSNSFTLNLCMDKIKVKKILAYHNIPTPNWDYAYNLTDEIREDLEYPLIVKPANNDDLIGITSESVVVNKEQLQAQLHKIIVELDQPALVEEYIEGDEYTVSILGSIEDNFRVLPLARSIFDNLPSDYWHIYSYEAKYSQDEVYKKIITQQPPKNINQKLQALITEISLDTYNILDCFDYGRVEVKVDKNNNPYVLELNPNPSIDIHDHLPTAAKLIGMDYGDLLEEIIKMTIERYASKSKLFFRK